MGTGEGLKREGAGGGFNEREVEYDLSKAAAEEDGYDEFGRKKKTKKDRATREAEALARLEGGGDVPSAKRSRYED